VTSLPVINKKTEIVICQLESHEISSDFYLSKKRFQEMLCLKYLVSKCLAHFFASKNGLLLSARQLAAHEEPRPFAWG
jgi:hypothetical protein